VTARRRPPKYKENNGEDDEDNKAAPVAKPAIIVDADDEDDEEDDEPPPENFAADEKLGRTFGNSAGVEGKSKLVREIQEEERKAKERSEKQQRDAKETAPSSSSSEQEKATTGIRFGRIDRAVAKNLDKYGETDVDELMATIQDLCQSTSPLGKCMDYVHEDLATMNKELDKWKLEYQDQKDILQREKELNQAAVEELELKLKQLDADVADEIQRTRQCKARIIKHEARIKELVTYVCTATYDPQELIDICERGLRERELQGEQKTSSSSSSSERKADD